MTITNPNDVNQGPLTNALKIAIVSSALTLTGVLASTAMSWVSSAQSTRSVEKLSCISRLDKQEEAIRSKGDAMMVSLAAITTLSINPDWKMETKASYVEAFARAGYSMSSYSENSLGGNSGALVTIVLDALKLDLDNSKRDALGESYKKAITDWAESFQKVLDGFEIKRTEC